MDLTELSVENYKPFKKRLAVAIKPITLVIGKNSSGKSALTRLPLLLRSGLASGAEAPLTLTVDGLDFGASFVDLIHGRNPHGRIGIGAAFDFGGHKQGFWAEVQNVDEYRAQYVSLLEVGTSESGRVTVRCDDVPKDLENVLYTSSEDAQSRELDFHGLHPFGRHPNDPVSELMNPFIVTALNEITHLGPFRDQPSRYYRYQGATPAGVGVGGTNAPATLGADFHRRTGVLEQVGAWYAKHLGGWELAVSPREDTFSLILKSPTRKGVDQRGLEVNLADVGIGMSQVLPIVVEHFLQKRRKGPHLHIVEQPELHLHPAAHASLADLYVDAAAPSRRFLIETHSENFLLRIRRRCAEGLLSPENVIIHWVENDGTEATVRPIQIDAKGDVDFWPTGVFSEDFAEVGAIRKANQEAP